MNVLGIESSCDETGAAIVREDGLVVSDAVASQVELHAPYGGVVPELASREHMRAIVPVVQRALEALPNGLDDVAAVCVTQGPGLVGALLVGIQVAKAIAWSRRLPLVGVNHLDGHLLAVFLRRGEGPHDPVPEGPFVALLASGGHTAVYRVDGDVQDIRLLGQTRDDAAGEAFDKVAKLLGLGYPGGPVIDRLAADGDPRAVPFPVPMAGRTNIEFSFSGLKTAVANRVARHGRPTNEQELKDLCASFQSAVVEALLGRAVLACEQENVMHLVLTGGVAANRGLRKRAREICDARGIQLYVPPFASCTDNAAMIAYAGLKQLTSATSTNVSLNAFSRDPERRRGRF